MLFAVATAIRFGDVKLRLFMEPALAEPKLRWVDSGRGAGMVVTESTQVRIITVGGTVLVYARCRLAIYGAPMSDG